MPTTWRSYKPSQLTVVACIRLFSPFSLHQSGESRHHRHRELRQARARAPPCHCAPPCHHAPKLTCSITCLHSPLYDILTSGWSLGQGRRRITQSNSVGAELCHGCHHCELTTVVLFCPPLSLVSVRVRLGLPLALGMTLPRVVVSSERNTTTTVAALTTPRHRARGQLGYRTPPEPAMALFFSLGSSAVVATLVWLD
jgi:hypothetical protein